MCNDLFSSLEKILYDSLTSGPAWSDLDGLSSRTCVEGVADIEIDSNTTEEGRQHVVGTATVETELVYGSSRDSTSSSMSFPVAFDLVLDADNSLVEDLKTTVDTSKFDE